MSQNNHITIRETSDESFEVLLNDQYLHSFNHDQHGWAGMQAVRDIVISLAEKLNIPINETDNYSE